MTSRLITCAAGVALTGLVVGCSAPLDGPFGSDRLFARVEARGDGAVPNSRYRAAERGEAVDLGEASAELSEVASADDYVRYALYHSPRVESAYQRWRAAAERLGQVGSLPDPRLKFGFFLDELETRTGAQQARIGVSQSFPWPGQLRDREDAAGRAASSAWRGFEAARLAVTERVVSTLHDLAQLDGTRAITAENLELLRSFEEVLRARYRVGEGSYPGLIRVQVELGQLEDRLKQLEGMRPAYVAELNAVLNRPSMTGVPVLGALPGRVVSLEAEQLAEMANNSNPVLLGLDEKIEEQRFLSEDARKNGLPTVTVGLDYLVTDEASNSSIAESGDDPILLSFGMNVPIWRDKYDAGVRETIARRLAVAGERQDEANRIAAGIHRAWFEHTDADRRVRLYERTLIPKAEESLKASLAGFRAGETSFLDLLDTERTLLEFAVAAVRARSESGKALARLSTLVGEPVPTDAEDEIDQTEETNEEQS